MSALTLADIKQCFTGIIPIVLCTSSAKGIPNITYMSRTHPVDTTRIAVSNQFMSKSSRNLAENPYASLLLIDPGTGTEYRCEVRYERTEKRGPIFDRMHNDISLIAGITHMSGVFQLKAADIFEVLSIELLEHNDLPPITDDDLALAAPKHATIGELCARISRSGDLNSLVALSLDGMDELLGYTHSTFMLLDESGERLFTIASHGYAEEGVGSEVRVGEGVAGMAAARTTPIVLGNVRNLTRYTNVVERGDASIGPGREIATPSLPNPASRMAVPALALGQLVGVLAVESDRHNAYSDSDIGTLVTIACLMASAVESLRSGQEHSEPAEHAFVDAEEKTTSVKFFDVDGSIFIENDYVIKGVAGRILWELLRQYTTDGRVTFTNRELRLNPSLDLPDFRDNFESRLILLKRRLDERNAHVRINKLGRGRFALDTKSRFALDPQ